MPYDVVYILNKYYATCGKAIEANSGRLDKFIGDGIMAIFEANDSIEMNCKGAVKAASEISKQIKMLSQDLNKEFSAELKMRNGHSYWAKYCRHDGVWRYGEPNCDR